MPPLLWTDAQAESSWSQATWMTDSLDSRLSVLLPYVQQKPLAAVLCKSSHPSLSSERNVLHSCSSLFLACLWGDSRSQPQMSHEMTAWLFIRKVPALRGGRKGRDVVQSQRKTQCFPPLLLLPHTAPAVTGPAPPTAHQHAAARACTEMFHSPELVPILWVAFTAGAS